MIDQKNLNLYELKPFLSPRFISLAFGILFFIIHTPLALAMDPYRLPENLSKIPSIPPAKIICFIVDKKTGYRYRADIRYCLKNWPRNIPKPIIPSTP